MDDLKLYGRRSSSFTISKKSLVPTLIISLYCICALTPYIYTYYFVLLCIVGVCVVFCTVFNLWAVLKKSRMIRISVLLLLISFIYRILLISTAAWGNYGIRFLCFVSLWCAYYTYMYLPINNRKFIITVIIVALMVNSVFKIAILKSNPDIIPVYIGTEYFNRTWGKLNLGATNYNYCMLMLIFAVFILLKDNAKYHINTNTKIIWLSVLLFSLYFNFVYSATGTIILSIFLFCLGMLLELKKDSKTIIKVVVLMCSMICFVVFFDYIFDYLISLSYRISGDKVAQRLITIRNIMSLNLTYNDKEVLSRFSLIIGDLKTWLKNPITFLFGYGFHTENRNWTDSANFIAATGAGNHSTIFDILARYGLLGFGLFTYFLHLTKRYFEKFIDNQKLLSVFYIVLIFNLIFNNLLFYNIALVTFFLIPYSRDSCLNVSSFSLTDNE